MRFMSSPSRFVPSFVVRRFSSLYAPAGLIIVWWAIAFFIVKDQTLLPDPVALALLIRDIFADGELLPHLIATLLRVAAAFLLALGLGAVIGILMGRYPAINRLLDSLVILLLNIPALVVIVLWYVWGGLSELSAIGAVALNKLPLVITIFREGARVLDSDIRAMCQLYQVPRFQYLRHILVPQLMPFTLAASRNGLALIWKIVLVVEFLGRSNGIGFQIHLYFQLFEMHMMLAYAFPFIIIMLGIEYGILHPWERKLSAWRHASVLAQNGEKP